MEGSEHGHLKIVKFLIENGATPDGAGGGILMVACKQGHLHIVKLLVVAGANVNAAYGGALSEASAAGHLKIFEYLQDRGAYKRASLMAPYHACVGGHLKILKRLLVGVTTMEGIDLLSVACEHGHLKTVRYLVKSGADVDADDELALRKACTSDFLDIAKHLQEHILPSSGHSQHRFSSL